MGQEHRTYDGINLFDESEIKAKKKSTVNDILYNHTDNKINF